MKNCLFALITTIYPYSLRTNNLSSDPEHYHRQSFSSAIRAVQRVVQREARVRLRPFADGGVHGLVAVGAEADVERLAAGCGKKAHIYIFIGGNYHVLLDDFQYVFVFRCWIYIFRSKRQVP